MGSKLKAECLDCGHNFTVSIGGGFRFHLLKCKKCGKSKSIGFDEIRELHHRYLKGLPGPYSVATSRHDEEIRTNRNIKPVSQKEYNREIERFAGNCKCGGRVFFQCAFALSEMPFKAFQGRRMYRNV